MPKPVKEVWAVFLLVTNLKNVIIVSFHIIDFILFNIF